MIRFDSNQYYQLEDIMFYLPKDIRNITLYCRLVDADGNECIAKMEQTGKESDYNIYQVSLDNAISNVEGSTKVVFIMIQNNTMKTVSAGNIHLKYDNFSMAHRLYLMNELSKSIALTYAKIEQLTEMNLQLYKDIQEVAGK